MLDEADPDRKDAAVAAFDGELAALRREVARLEAENSRLLRLLEPTNPELFAWCR